MTDISTAIRRIIIFTEDISENLRFGYKNNSFIQQKKKTNLACIIQSDAVDIRQIADALEKLSHKGSINYWR